MSLRLPSLPALRVFEAAARHLSFTKAAEELHVTQAAVSHQIRALEEQIGTALFQRTTRRLSLTPAGRHLLPAASAAFEGLARALADIGRGERLLAVTTTPSFGARWLAPRLGRFAEQHPDIELSIRHTTAVLDLARDGLDLAIRWGRGQWPGLTAEPIAAATVVPVSTAAYAKRLKLREPADIARATLLHEDCQENWIEWCLVAGLDPALARRGVVFDDDNVLIQAMLDGQGVGLISQTLVAADLEAGRLVTPLGLPVDEGYSYYLVYEPDALCRRKVAAFRDFILAEAQRPRPAGPSSS